MSYYTRFAVVPTLNGFMPFMQYHLLDMPGVCEDTPLIVITLKNDHASTPEAQEEEIIKLESALRENKPPEGYRFDTIKLGFAHQIMTVYPTFQKALVGTDVSNDDEEWT